MTHPALKGEVSKQKMLLQRNPRLRRTDVVSDSFSGRVSDAAKEFSRTPEMSLRIEISYPRMLVHNFKGGVAFKQLESFANTHGGGHLNKQVDMVNSDVKFINPKSFSISNLPDEVFTIHPDAVKLHRSSSILWLPHKVEGILSEGMLCTSQIHFSSPIAHANFSLVSEGLESNPSLSRIHNQLNFEGGNSSIGLKTEVPLPRM